MEDKTDITVTKQKPWLFKKGESGNLNGRPKGALSLTTKVRNALETIGKGEKDPYDIQLIRVILDKAINEKSENMIKLIWNYMDGVPKQYTSMNLESKGVPILGLSFAKETEEKVDEVIDSYLNKNQS